MEVDALRLVKVDDARPIRSNCSFSHNAYFYTRDANTACSSLNDSQVCVEIIFFLIAMRKHIYKHVYKTYVSFCINSLRQWLQNYVKY